MDVTENFQTLQPALRIVDDSLDCFDQPVPFEGRYVGVSILNSLHKMHAPVVQPLVVDHQTAGLVAQQLHHIVRGVHEHEHVAAVQVLPHVAFHYPAQHIEVLPHVRGLRIKPELRTVSKAEHGLQAFQDRIHHGGGQSALDPHVGATYRTELNAHPVLSGGVGLGFAPRCRDCSG